MRLTFAAMLLVVGIGCTEEEKLVWPEGFPTITRCYEWWIGDSKDPCPEGYGEVIVNTPTSDLNELDCKESIGILVVCGRVVQ